MVAFGKCRTKWIRFVLRLLDFSAHLIEPLEGGIHHGFTCSYFCRGDLRVCAVSTFCGPFDGREVLVVSVAIAKEEQVLGTRTFAQAVGVLAEKFSGAPDDRYFLIEQSNR